MSSLGESFDIHLAQAENLSCLCFALNDEVFDVREMAICILGRLSGLNPAYVMPILRKVLIQVACWCSFVYFFCSYVFVAVIERARA